MMDGFNNRVSTDEKRMNKMEGKPEEIQFLTEI